MVKTLILGEVDKPNIENGVYIEATDGVLYTYNSWNNSKIANGVVISTDKICVRMALTGEVKSISGGGDGFDTFQPSFVTLGDALTDFDGKTNTRFLLTENGRMSKQGDTTCAAPYAKGYVFPDVVTGKITTL